MLNKLKPTIAVIDSGIGGISVLNQLLLKFKTGNYIYFADNLFMPYGNKSAKFVKTRVEEIIESLNKNYQPDYVIVACNTASSVIDKAKYNNVLTIEFNKSNPILATSLTSKQLAGFHVIADKNLANLIEKYIDDKNKMKQIIKNKVKLHNLSQYKSITLGCTHYELTKKLFESFCPNTIFKLNSKNLVESISFEPKQAFLTIKLLFSKKDENYQQTILKLINKPNI